MWVRKAQQFTTSIIIMYGVLVGKVKEFLEEQLETIAQTKGYKILEARVMPDHIHLFIEADPFDSPNIVKIFKGVAGLGMSRRFADIVPKLRRGSFLLC